MNPVIEQIKRHRSIRKYRQAPIAEETIRTLVECGQAAATSSFIQAYSIIRVKDRKKREAIAAAAGGQVWVENAAEFFVVCADLSRVEYCSRKSAGGDLEGYTEHFIAATVDAALMAQNLLLAAESEGLGGVFIGGIRNAPDVVAETLNLPELVYPVFGLCLGWPDQDPDLKPRLPVDVVLHQDRYHSERIPGQIDDYDLLMEEYYNSRKGGGRQSNWSTQTTAATQGKKRPHMLEFLRQHRFLRR